MIGKLPSDFLEYDFIPCDPELFNRNFAPSNKAESAYAQNKRIVVVREDHDSYVINDKKQIEPKTDYMEEC